jgi:hypothetical protein
MSLLILYKELLPNRLLPSLFSKPDELRRSAATLAELVIDDSLLRTKKAKLHSVLAYAIIDPAGFPTPVIVATPVIDR